jgi:UMF1 family MFS transporter
MAEATSAGKMPEATRDVGAAAAARPRPATLLGQLSWALFDAGRGPYSILINTFVFSAYFSAVVFTDPVRGQEVWSYLTAIGAFLVAIGAPVLGAIADAGGRRKPWLAACVILGVPCMAALWYATPGMPPGFSWVFLAPIGATLAFEYSAIFCNAMLPNVSSAQRIGFLSGLGWALANFLGIALFLFFLLGWIWNPHPLFGVDVTSHEPERLVGLMAGLCLAVCSIPLFLFTPDSPGTSRRMSQMVSEGLNNLADTLTRLGRYRNVMIFIVARMIFNEGFILMILFTGVFAAGILHWTAEMLTIQGLCNSVLATCGGLLAGWLDTRIGSRRSTMVFVAGCFVANLVLCTLTPNSVLFIDIAPASGTAHGLFSTLPDKLFFATQACIALLVTGGLVTSRTLMARISPPAMLNEFFGIYAMSGTATSFVGPLAVAVLTWAFQSQRAGVAVGVVFLLGGLLVMTRVREERTP